MNLDPNTDITTRDELALAITVAEGLLRAKSDSCIDAIALIAPVAPKAAGYLVAAYTCATQDDPVALDHYIGLARYEGVCVGSALPKAGA